MSAYIIEAAEFIIANSVAIWGCGDTEDAAWEDLRSWYPAIIADVPHESDVDTEDAYCAPYWNKDGFVVIPATAALVDELKVNGGQIAFATINGIACTLLEEEAFDDARHTHQGAAP